MTNKVSKEPRRSIGGRIRRYFLAGTATILPIFLTIYLLAVLFGFVNHVAGEPINDLLARFFGFRIPGLGLIISAGTIMLVGYLSHHWFGRRVFPVVELLLRKTPLVTSIYPSAKQLSDFLFAENKKRSFKEVVLVEYPSQGSYSLGFITNERIEEFDRRSRLSLVSVFVPLAPAPFSGYILLLPRSKVLQLDVPVDQAIKFVVSGGIIAPSQKSENVSGIGSQE